MSTAFYHYRNTLWQLIDDEGSFRVTSPDALSRLYFPLANEGGILSSITPDLHGDIKTSHDSFLMLPVSVSDLHNTKSSRNFWVYVEGKGAWSLTGASSKQLGLKFFENKKEKTTLEAGFLWHKITRENEALGYKSEITNFAPKGHDPVEIMMVSFTNTGKSKIKVTPTSAIPIYGRSADNLRDHRHVTSLLQRILYHPHGVMVKPTMSFDERGHKINELFYCVLGSENGGEAPVGIFPTIPSFIGEGGNFENPKAVIENLAPPHKETIAYQGKPGMGALRFKTQTLSPGQKISFVLILGIANKENDSQEWLKKYGTFAKAQNALAETKEFWKEKLKAISFQTRNKDYDAWIKWVSLQPTLRKLFGCSFLPDFDYGRGGRGWRDLWQDCLALLLTSASSARQLLVNNFNGIRIDGSNATIIGTMPGEFIADRNNITRVWMDHGVWPYLTLELYIHQTGDVDILFENIKYFRDKQQSRARRKDSAWNEEYGNHLKTKKGAVVESSILEHILVQHLVQFFNVGEHNHIRLENADWNDGLDMAYERGESVAFTTLFGSNLKKLATLLDVVAKKKQIKKVVLSKELLILLDRVSGKKVDYGNWHNKTKRLNAYFEAVEPEISGTKIEVPIAKLIADLNQKSEFITQHVRQKEWISSHSGEGFYNGYYDNHGRRVEGDFPSGFRMTLAGQVFPIMSGVAENNQIAELYKTAKKHLKDKEHGGFRLNTDFGEIRLDLGRAFGFAYGEKENGAFFSHMSVMFANALYQRNFVNEGCEVLSSIFQMCLNTDKSKIYPGVPEYFNSEGRGMYYYLTGSASWLVLTVLTQVYGVRGHFGDLLLAPKLTQHDFHGALEVSVNAQFAERKYKISYKNAKKIAYEHYVVSKVAMNGKPLLGLELNKKEVLIPKELLLKHSKKSDNTIVVTLE